MDRALIKIEPHFFFMACLYLLALPLGAMKGMVLAAIFHELGHLTATAVFGGSVRKIVIGAWGTQIQADFSEHWHGIVCAAAGPISSLLLTLLYPVFPQIAVWGMMQGILNLLPIYPLDGGRIWRMLNSERVLDSDSSRSG